MVLTTLIRHAARSMGIKTSPGPKYIRILEYEPKKKFPSFADRFQATPTSKPVVQVKICTVAKMHQLLQPKLCNCPNLPCSMVPIGVYISMALRWVFFAAIVKYTADKGFWSRHDTSIPLYNKISTFLSKEVFFVKRPDPRTAAEKYEMAVFTYNFAEAYNAFVRNTLTALFSTPSLLYDGAMLAYDYIYGQVRSTNEQAPKDAKNAADTCKTK